MGSEEWRSVEIKSECNPDNTKETEFVKFN